MRGGDGNAYLKIGFLHAPHFHVWFVIGLFLKITWLCWNIFFVCFTCIVKITYFNRPTTDNSII